MHVCVSVKYTPPYIQHLEVYPRGLSNMRNLQYMSRLLYRSFSTTGNNFVKNKVPQNQKIFQEDNGIPVHIKGGTVDVLLYRFTMAITVAGTGFSLYWLLIASLPKKN
ncbi:CX7A2 oxidase, partial [Polypterus senegalus]